MYTKTPPKDLQKVWHEFVGKYFKNKNINSVLDVGSGWGKAKERLKIITENVKTQDINRALMNTIDYVCWPASVNHSYDLVTAFDVIEHVTIDILNRWIDDICFISNKYIFVATPNGNYHPNPWHYPPNEFLNIFDFHDHINLINKKYFVRFKTGNEDYIKEVNKEEFIVLPSYGLGFCFELDIKNE